ncbi:MAG: rod shape-determining protein RodA [Candidatus Yanofskybacteria bacterium]|nr:rod shape-determining protein RodA [Candidatus Yanofskybacteria bacterium]
MDPRSVFRAIRRTVVLALAGSDVPLIIGVCAMGVLSALNLYGIGGVDHTLFRRQVVLVAIGVALMVVMSFVNYRYLKNHTLPVLVFYGGALTLLASTLLFSEIRNIRAWIQIGGFQFEPSELMKLAVVVLLAKYFSQRHVHIRQFRHIVVSGLYAAIPAVVVLQQPDLGSAAIIMIVWLVMLVSVGMRMRHLFLLGAVGVVGAYMAWIWALAPYQRDRISAFIDPYADPTGYGYHIIQSKVAIGSGGVWGAGLGKGSQATLGFLPEPYNDFAFAALTEQFGAVGAIGALGILAFIVWRILRIGRFSDNNFARLFCVGIGTVIFAHTFISASVNMGLLPITGIPMTMLSYGGSHLLSIMIALGFVQSIQRYG